MSYFGFLILSDVYALRNSITTSKVRLHTQRTVRWKLSEFLFDCLENSE
jgi:hypothetical protein